MGGRRPAPWDMTGDTTHSHSAPAAPDSGGEGRTHGKPLASDSGEQLMGRGGRPARGGSAVIWVPVFTPAGQWLDDPSQWCATEPTRQEAPLTVTREMLVCRRKAVSPAFPARSSPMSASVRPFWAPGLEGALSPCPGGDPLPHDTAAGVWVLGLPTGPLRPCVKCRCSPRLPGSQILGTLAIPAPLPACPSVRGSPPTAGLPS